MCMCVCLCVLCMYAYIQFSWFQSIGNISVLSRFPYFLMQERIGEYLRSKNQKLHRLRMQLEHNDPDLTFSPKVNEVWSFLPLQFFSSSLPSLFDNGFFFFRVQYSHSRSRTSFEENQSMLFERRARRVCLTSPTCIVPNRACVPVFLLAYVHSTLSPPASVFHECTFICLRVYLNSCPYVDLSLCLVLAYLLL